MDTPSDKNLPAPLPGQERIVILGAGFGGLKAARMLSATNKYQLLIIDRNNYHQFQPLLYQVATAGLEPSSISFPIRKIFQANKNVFIRVAEVEKIDPGEKNITTNKGVYQYDKLIISLGTSTNYFGNNQLETNAIGLKSIPEALYIRNQVLKNYENALISTNEEEQEAALNIVIAGGGPTGVELAGAIAELRNNILPREYPELDFSKMNIFLIEAADRLLNGMSLSSSHKAKKYLQKLGVNIQLNTRVDAYDGRTVRTSGMDILSLNVIWSAGMKGVPVKGLPESAVLPGGRILVNEYSEVKGLEQVYAVGDIAAMITPQHPKGHPQVAPVAISQAENLAGNIILSREGKSLRPFRYKDKGVMATVGRNLAVVELPFVKFGGFMAWFTWMFVHLMSILGIKNKFFIFVNWVTSYFSYNLSLRLIIKPGK